MKPLLRSLSPLLLLSALLMGACETTIEPEKSESKPKPPAGDVVTKFSDDIESLSYTYPSNTFHDLVLTTKTSNYDFSSYDSLRVTVTAEVNNASNVWAFGKDSLVVFILSLHYIPGLGSAEHLWQHLVQDSTELLFVIPTSELINPQARFHFYLVEYNRPANAAYPIPRTLEFHSLKITGYK